jgi:hypothetical protein
MNKDLEKLINPPWLESIQRLQKQTSFAALALQESEAMRSIRKFSESTKLASLAISQSEFMKFARLASESSKLASLAFQESEAMKSIRQITDSSRFAALVLQESEAMRSFKSVAESTRLSSIVFQQSEAAKQLQVFAKTSQLASIALSQSDAFKQLSQLNSLASFKALANLRNSPFSDLSLVNFAPQITAEQVIDESLVEIDSKISQEILSETDFNALSDNTKKILIYLYHYYFLPVVLACLTAYMMMNAGEARKELQSVSTPAEVRSFVCSSNGNFDRQSLKGFRVTTVGSLNFRDSPNMKSEVITTLPIGALVEVIDKSHRSWLLVEAEIDGELEQGWVSRRYTSYFK